MAANCPLVMGYDQKLTPAPFAGEYFVLGRGGIKIEVDNVRTKSGKWKAEGALFLSHVRLVFVTPKADSSGLQSFDFPLTLVNSEKFNQPIFGCNNLSFCCNPIDGGANPAPHKVKLYLTQGGCGTLLPMLWRLLELTRQELMRVEQQRRASQYPTVVYSHDNFLPQVQQMATNTAYVDPNDPSTIYVTQPVGQNQVMKDEERPYEPTGLMP